MNQITSANKPKVLVVDDEPTNIHVAAKALEESYELLVATDGKKAIETTNEQLPDLVLLDIMMPEMDGFEVAQRIHSNPLTKNIPIIFLTAKQHQEDVKQGFQFGAKDYIRKPFKPDELQARVASQIESYTLQERLDRELKIGKQNWKMLDDNVAFAFVSFNGEIEYASNAFCKEFRCKPEELQGKNFNMLSSGKMQQDFYKKLWTTISSEKPFESEILDKTCNGELHWYHSTIVPRYDEDRTWIGYTAFYKNIDDKIKLKQLSERDDLTGLANRLRLNNILDDNAEQFARHSYPFSIILLDLDYFKNINDQHGHQIGDLILKELSLLLKNQTRKLDKVGRWGGEEFLIVCPSTNEEGAFKLANNLQKIIASWEFPVISQLTCSFGVATFNTQTSLDHLFKEADKALYQAKSEGRNKVVKSSDLVSTQSPSDTDA